MITIPEPPKPDTKIIGPPPPPPPVYCSAHLLVRKAMLAISAPGIPVPLLSTTRIIPPPGVDNSTLGSSIAGCHRLHQRKNEQCHLLSFGAPVYIHRFLQYHHGGFDPVHPPTLPAPVRP